MGKRETLTVDFFRDRELIATLTKGSDRDAAILAGTILEELLCRLLQKRFVQGNVFNNAIESSNASLSTFSNKIQISYLLGIISKRMYDDLNRIRKIRNIFAHNIRGCSFDDKNIQSIVNTLTYADLPLFSEWLPAASFKDKFLMHCTIIEIAIVKKIVRFDSILECEDETNNIGFEEVDWKYLSSEVEDQHKA